MPRPWYTEDATLARRLMAERYQSTATNKTGYSCRSSQPNAPDNRRYTLEREGREDWEERSLALKLQNQYFVWRSATNDALQPCSPIEAEGSPETSEVGPRQRGENRDILKIPSVKSTYTVGREWAFRKEQYHAANGSILVMLNLRTFNGHVY